MSNSKPQRNLAQAIIVAAGSSQRMQGTDKVFSLLLGKPVLAHSIQTFLSCEEIDCLVVVLQPERIDLGIDMVKKYGWELRVTIVAGGERRQDSVCNGLKALGDSSIVLIHDGARPCIETSLIMESIQAVQETGAATAAIPVSNTIKKTNASDIVTETLDRSQLWSVQTPQVFHTDLLLAAHSTIKQDVTDDAAMVELMGTKVKVFMGAHSNIKITHPTDLLIAQEFLKGRELP